MVALPGDAVRQDEFERPFYIPFWGLLGDFDIHSLYAYNPPHMGDLRNLPATLVPLGTWIYVLRAVTFRAAKLLSSM